MIEPLTLDGLCGSGRRVMASCNACGHVKGFAAADLIAHPMPGATPVGDVSKRLRCAACGSRDVISFAESARSVRQGSAR